MHTVASPAALQAWSRERRGQTIGLVPTMGFLHDGHVSLMEQLRPQVDHLAVSIFVNPLQFGAGEDLDVYPRDLPGDLARCEQAGVDVVFTPEGSMYPEGFQTSVSVHELSTGLCGGRRPGHFDGVCTVVARLFGLSGCTHAIFGEKDYQQLAVLRRMTRDLALPVEVLGAPLVRDADGVALSSRNKYLDPAQRKRARSLHRALFALRDAAASGTKDARTLLALAAEQLEVDRLDYLELVDPDSLQPLDEVSGPARALVAAFVSSTRLIDNVAVLPPGAE